MKIECTVPGRPFTELNETLQELIMKLLPGDQYESLTYHIGKDYIGCKLGKKMKFMILKNHYEVFATADPWPDKLV